MKPRILSLWMGYKKGGSLDKFLLVNQWAPGDRNLVGGLEHDDGS